MIVKDEAAVIERCLDSVRPLIDDVLICDTGSTDGTQEIVRDWLERNNVNGKVIDESWVSFGHNRTSALAALRDRKVDYALVIDADDVLEINGDPKAIKQKLTADCYSITIRHGGLVHHRPQICSNKKPFCYRGVVHEFLDSPVKFTRAELPELSMLIHNDGARRRQTAGDTHRHDAELLEAALKNGTDPDLKPRYSFYLAQSWRDCGEAEKALAVYLDRVELGGWVEETYVALINAARLQQRLGEPFVETLATWRRAMVLIPTRAEAFHGAAKLCRETDCHHEAVGFAKRGLRLKEPEGLFVERYIYEWGLLDEYAVAAYWAGLVVESWLACRLILERDDLDLVTRKRILRNAEFAG